MSAEIFCELIGGAFGLCIALYIPALTFGTLFYNKAVKVNAVIFLYGDNVRPKVQEEFIRANALWSARMDLRHHHRARENDCFTIKLQADKG